MKMPNCAVRALLVLVLYGGFTDDRIPQPHYHLLCKSPTWHTRIQENHIHQRTWGAKGMLCAFLCVIFFNLQQWTLDLRNLQPSFCLWCGQNKPQIKLPRKVCPIVFCFGYPVSHMHLGSPIRSNRSADHTVTTFHFVCSRACYARWVI